MRYRLPIPETITHEKILSAQAELAAVHYAGGKTFIKLWLMAD